MNKTQEEVSLKKIIAFVVARGMPAVVNFLAMAFYAHHLAPAAYGEYSLSLFLSGLLSASFFSWLAYALQRFYSVNENENAILQYTLGKAFFAISFILLIVSIPFYFWLHKFLFYIVMLTIAQSFFQLCLQLIVVQVQAIKYALISTGNAILSFLMAIIFIKLGWGVLGILIAIITSNVLTVIKIYFNNWHVYSKIESSRSVLKACFFYGYPLSVSMILGVMVYGLDRAMLGYFSGKASVGLYTLPFDLASQSITLLFMSFQLYLYPLVLRNLNSNGKEGANKCLAENGRIFLIVILPCMLILMNFSSWIGQVITGPEFRTAFSQILPLIAVGSVLRGFKAYYFDLAFQLSNKTVIQVYIDGVTLVINFVLNLFVIPRYSYLGAAYVSIFSAMSGLLLSFLLGKVVFEIPILISLKNMKIFGCAAVMFFLFNQVNKLTSWYYVLSLSFLIVIIYFIFVLFPLNKWYFWKK